MKDNKRQPVRWGKSFNYIEIKAEEQKKKKNQLKCFKSSEGYAKIQ